MKRLHILLLILFVLTGISAKAQEYFVEGVVRNAVTNLPVDRAEVFIQDTGLSAVTDSRGNYRISGLKPGKYQVAIFCYEHQTQMKEVGIASGGTRLDFFLEELKVQLEEVTVEDELIDNAGIRRLQAVEGAVIYEAKKSEVIVLDNITANLSTNNARQIFAKVPGLNIWESDGAGLQLGIGARGLDPNRTSNFNVRQNGYDISADALGYPESYYTPPSEALNRIEVVRGAASLQYGTQFGGLLNFVLKEGPKNKPFEVVSRQSAGSFGLFNSFNSIGGTKGKINYYSFFQHKQGEGWRPNSSFDLNTAYAAVKYSFSDKFDVTGQYTWMRYLAQQPGGLTDALFYENPRQSIRDRNWFRVDWNLMALLADYRFSNQWKLNARVFGLIGGRDALGNLGRIDRIDDEGERDLFVDDFKNFGTELRLVHKYTSFGNQSALVLGARYYEGFTHRQQGLGPDGREADFSFLNPENLEGSDYDFPGKNFSLFAENVFNLSDKISITPGIRFERIRTEAEGYYQDKVLRPNPDTGIAEDSVFVVHEHKERTRSFVIAGIGVSIKPNEKIEMYGNFSQNYRAINFNDIRVVNPNLTVDPEIRDEKGFNADLGIRGGMDGLWNFDASIFYLQYNDRIGSMLRVDDENFRIYRYRTNIADSRHLGVELFGQVDLITLLKQQGIRHKLIVFGNLAVIDAKYVKAEESSADGKQVEMVPRYNVKSGISWKFRSFETTFQYNFTSKQFSDATNAEFTPSAVEGMVPAYSVLDLSARYSIKFLTIEGGVNNLSNEMYFTRRASGYPGPGILPADGRNFYLTLQVRL